AVSRWESETCYPDIELLPSIAAFFSVSTDTLLGVNRTEREKRLLEIYDIIDEHSETGDDTEETLREARGFAAEFPTDEKVQEHLADTLCRIHMWSPDGANREALKEAEKIYLTLIENTKDVDFRNKMLEALLALYSVGYKDGFKAESMLEKLPSMKYSRERVASELAEMTREKDEYRQEFIEMLTAHLGTALENYVIDGIPNTPDMWDKKIEMFEYVIELYKFVFGENLLYYHADVAGIYRVIATYKLSQKKYDEALDVLEKMCEHILLGNAAKSGEKFTSHFANRLAYPERGKDFNTLIAHNCAYYTLNGKLAQKRYDPIRETERFKTIVEKLEQIAE
ncbi:MAG: hypothetical protein IJW21_01485, partial [Clostridia bacterium]|nr:hypothetical protein [Clostridia bacterium]